MKTHLKLHLLLLSVGSLSGFVYGQGTTIGYQGRLNEEGVPATGLYDLTFAVFDAEAEGNALGGPIPLDAVPVTNGLLQVSLDFGFIFPGTPRWLEITVRTNGVGLARVLTPRTALLPTPYAIYALRASTVDDVSITVDHFDTGGVGAAPGQFLSYNGGGLSWVDAEVAAGDTFLRLGTAAYYNAGNVGIGTDAPAHRLSLAGGPAWTANGWIGALALPNASAIGWESNAGGQRFGMGPSTGGFYFFRSASNPGTIESPAVYDMMITDAGNLLVLNGRVGIGTTTPEEQLTIANVFGQSSGLKITGVGVAGVGMAIENLFAGGHKWDLVSGDVFNPFVPSAVGNFRIVDETANATRLVIAPDGNVGIGNLANPQAKLDVQGTIRTTALTITGGADIAEPFPFSSANIAQGSVMIIDEENPGRLKLSMEPYDTRVAGIVSGANGIQPGISLYQQGALEGGQNVALSGRVYVLGDASTGAIKPGDLLTTSGTPGHAMKVSDHSRSQGAILGKAMSALPDGKGMVLVLVTLQ